jgi:exodeoxyribonuclease-3
METRVVTATAGSRTFASIYVPNGGKDYPAKLAFFRDLIAWTTGLRAAGREVVLCGDMNIARAEIDVHPKERNATVIGQKPEERALFETWLEAGLVDVGRAQSPADDGMFTWWPYWRQAREKNVGWRLDYVLASPMTAARATKHEVQRAYGSSDHAPVIVELAD